MTKEKALKLNKEGSFSYWQKVFTRLKRHRLAMISLYILIAIIVIVVFVPMFVHIDPNKVDLAQALQPPSPHHIMGTDDNGRDEFIRLLYGGRISLLVGFAVTFFSGLLGIFVGLWAGYKRGFLDNLLMRINEIMMTIPELPLLIVAAKMRFIPNSVVKLIVIMSAFGWVGIARLIRGETLSVREEEYIEASKAIGVPDRTIVWKHLLPNTMAVSIVWATLRIGRVIIAEATLSFFGLGVQPPTPSWGNMLLGAQTYIWTSQWLVWWPGLSILLVTLLFNFLGDGLRDAMDPKLFL
ncbi:MAG: ABC transporter permease [Caldisericaceae bacterium]|nr:ABC transporter permease [Caldisericaceae bacterium]